MSTSPSATPPQSKPTLTQDQLRTILQNEIAKYIRQGYRVASQTDTTAQLVKPKKLSCLLVLLFGLTVIGLIIYVIVYLMSSDKQIYIEVDHLGNIRTQASGHGQSVRESAPAKAIRVETERTVRAQTDAENRAIRAQRDAEYRANKEKHDAEKRAWQEAHPGEMHPDTKRNYIIAAIVGGGILMVCGFFALIAVLGALSGGGKSNSAASNQSNVAASNPTPTLITFPVDNPTSTQETSDSVIPSTSTPETASSNITPAAASDNSCSYCHIECPGGQGQIEFCLADPQLVNDQSAFEATLRSYCGDHLKQNFFCQLMVWSDSSYLPSSLPMTDEQLNNQVGQFNRNDNTGLTCFQALSDGETTYSSPDCQ